MIYNSAWEACQSRAVLGAGVGGTSNLLVLGWNQLLGKTTTWRGSEPLGAFFSILGGSGWGAGGQCAAGAIEYYISDLPEIPRMILNTFVQTGLGIVTKQVEGIALNSFGVVTKIPTDTLQNKYFSISNGGVFVQPLMNNVLSPSTSSPSMAEEIIGKVIEDVFNSDAKPCPQYNSSSPNTSLSPNALEIIGAISCVALGGYVIWQGIKAYQNSSISVEKIKAICKKSFEDWFGDQYRKLASRTMGAQEAWTRGLERQIPFHPLRIANNLSFLT